MSRKKPDTPRSSDKVVRRAPESGLTTRDIRPAPILFGTRQVQSTLIEIARNGSVPYEPKSSTHQRLIARGVCVAHKISNRVLELNPAFPAYDELRALLTELAGRTESHKSDPARSATLGFNSFRPLSFGNSVDLHLVFLLAKEECQFDTMSLQRRLTKHYTFSIKESIKRLISLGILAEGEGGQYGLSSSVPASFKAFILKMAEICPGFTHEQFESVAIRVAAYVQAPDGAPRFFGTDARLRNLIALAVYGPMLYIDLRKITGVQNLRREGTDHAPFGRGGQIRTWDTPHGLAVSLDETYPLHLPLRRFLLKLAETYPPGYHNLNYTVPEPPPPQAWAGERLALFGSALPTSVLICLCLPSHWTFEAICCEVASGFYREVVKKTVRRLEDEGVLQGSRPRGPGFGPRLLSLADTCLAREELQVLIDAVPIAWPDLGERVRLAMDGIPNKTKEYFRRRGLGEIEWLLRWTKL